MKENNLTDIEKKAFELIKQGDNRQKMLKELGISSDELSKILEKYATIELNAPELKENSTDFSYPRRTDEILRDGEYRKNPLDTGEFDGLEQVGDEFFIDGQQVDITVVSRKLTPIQEEIYSLMSGKFDGQPKNLEQIAQEMGMDTQEIQEIIENINQKLYGE